MRGAALVLLLLLPALSGCLGDEEHPIDIEPIRMNDVVLKGTHNSYHLKPLGGEMIDRYNYSHLSLREQADELGVRVFELDVWYTPGLGLRVYHNLYDSATTCAAFTDCLGELHDWSEANPSHVPMWILIEPKDAVVIVEGVDILEMIEADIASVWNDSAVLTPDKVRGESPTLREQITAGEGWPRLDDVRGMTAFALLEKGEVRDGYIAAKPGLENATMFTFSPIDAPEAALVSWVHPIERGSELETAIEMGFMTRSRPDVDTVEAREGNYSRFDAIRELGVHMVSTDYPGNDVEVDFAIWFDHPVMCAPGAPPHCEAAELEAWGNYSPPTN